MSNEEFEIIENNEASPDAYFVIIDTPDANVIDGHGGIESESEYQMLSNHYEDLSSRVSKLETQTAAGNSANILGQTQMVTSFSLTKGAGEFLPTSELFKAKLSVEWGSNTSSLGNIVEGEQIISVVLVDSIFRRETNHQVYANEKIWWLKKSIAKHLDLSESDFDLYAGSIKSGKKMNDLQILCDYFEDSSQAKIEISPRVRHSAACHSKID